MMDIEPCRERLTPSISTYNDGGLVGKPVRVLIRFATAVGVSIRTLAIAGIDLLIEKVMIRSGIGKFLVRGIWKSVNREAGIRRW